jgi:predicted transcriptional regulator
MTRKQFLALAQETSKRIYTVTKKGNKFTVNYATILNSNILTTEKKVIVYAESWRDLANNFL